MISYKKLALISFGWLADKYVDHFKPLRSDLVKARIKFLLKTWLAITFFTTSLVYLGSLLSIFILSFFIELIFPLYTVLLIFVPILTASFTFLIFYLYPMERGNSKIKSIENNLPFSITHMSAIASSGIPPEYMFELLTGFKEYGEVAEESKLIVNNMKTFGMSSVAAIKNVAAHTPSKSFKEILLGITSVIETGGDLIAYLKEMSDKSLFEYRIKREKYLKTLSIYADIYTALLVAAPLMMLATLATMGIIGGTVMGLSIQDLITLVTWIFLPFINTAFLAFVHITYPGI